MSKNDLNKGAGTSENQIKAQTKNRLFPLREDNLNQGHEFEKSSSDQIEDLKNSSTQTVSMFKELYTNEFLGFRNYIQELDSITAAKQEYFQNKINEYLEEKNAQENLLQGKKRRAAQKISYITNLQGEYLWSYKENFVGTNSINTTVENSLHINPSAEQATLPVVKSSNVYIKEFIIGADSNCIVGAPEGGYNNINNLHYANDNMYFSVYKKSDTKCFLDLEVVLREETVINHLYISFPTTSYSPLKEISDIIFCDSSYNEISIKDIGKSDLKISQTSGQFETYFLPVEANKIKIKLEQPESYSANNILVNRIDIAQIRVYQEEYAESGVIESKELNSKSYYTAKINTDIFPIDKSSISERAFINSTNVNIGEVLTLAEPRDSINFKLEISRKDSTSILLAQDEFYNFETRIRYIDPYIPYYESFEEDKTSLKTKSCQVIEGFLKDSSDLKLPASIQNIEDLKVIYKSGNTEYSVEGASELDPVAGDSRIKILSGEYSPEVLLQEDGYYKFSIGEFIELDSLQISLENEIVECNKLYKINNNKIDSAFVKSSELNLEEVESALSDYSIGFDAYNTRSKIVKNTLVLLDGLKEVYNEVEYINGRDEFLSVSNIKTEFLPSQNVSSQNIISFEPEEIIYEAAGEVTINKDGIQKYNVLFEDNVNPEELALDTPTIDRGTNVLYLKTSDSNFFRGYSLSYKYLFNSNTSVNKYSANYSSGVIYFSNSVDSTKRIKYKKYDNLIFKFKLAQYLNVSTQGNTVEIYSQDSFKNLNKNIGHIYTEISKQTLSLENKERFYSPIINSIEVNVT